MATASNNIQDNYNGKVILKVKSGPGDIVGETELDIINNKVEFKNIIFNEPGDYILSVTTTVNNTEIKEISIKVLPEDLIIKQDDSNVNDDKKEITGERIGITQIDQPTIKIDPISNIMADKTEDNNNIISSLGSTPLFYYNGYQIKPNDIKYFKLYYSGVMPKVNIRFVDTLGFMRNLGTPKADTKFDIFLNSNSNSIKYIHIKFKIEKFEKLSGDKYDIIGTIDIPLLYRHEYLSYTGTSFDVLRQMSKEMQLGFNSNIIQTNDNMVWKNPSKYTFEFMSNIMSNSYIDDKSYVFGYIDFYYCMNYVDLEKEFNRNNSSDLMIDTTYLSKDSTKNEEERLTKLILSNDKSLNNSSLYFESDLKYKNNSTRKSLKYGNSRVSKIYDSVNKVFQIFNVDSLTSDGDKTIIMKGAEGDGEDFNNNKTNHYLGKTSDDNVHKNFQYANIHNDINLSELTKITMDISLPNPNFNLYRFQKVSLNVVNQTPTPSDGELINWRLTGDWLVYDIIYLWNGKSIKQDLRLIRKELGKNPDEIKNAAPVEKREEAKNEVNENPLDPNTEIKPNSKYGIGDLYTIQDDKGIYYLVKILELSEDGKDVKAEIKKLKRN